MIRASKHLTIIWTNHAITAVIAKQTKMITSNTDKLNLRLVKIEMYLSQFELNIRHKFDRDHVISDALFRLSFFDEKSAENQNTDTLNDIDAYVEILMKMSFIFKERLVQAYRIDKKWSVIYVMLAILKTPRTQTTRRDIVNNEINTRELSENALIEQYSSRQGTLSENFAHDEIEFERKNDLIYHLNRVTSKTRLCIFKFLIKEIFQMRHDDLAHVDFHRAYAAISKTLYIRRLFHHLRQYIDYCSECMLNQIKRHKLYDALNLISSSKISFHTITMNFVLTLSQSRREKFDTMLIITNMFFKRKLLISDVNIWKTKTWALKLLRYLQLCNWDIFRVIIFDRNAKFRFELWRWIFKILKIDFLTSTAYHSQTDDQSERTNQTIEIALRYLLTRNSDESWHEALSFLQHSYMNIITSTEYSSNQMLYKHNINWKLFMIIAETNFLHEMNREDVNLSHIRDIVRRDVVNVIDFVNVRAKMIYDDHHKSMTFNSEDKVFLRLHHEYSLSKKSNFKLSNQRANSYTIIRKIENAAYELNLSENSRIHFVIFIAQLESASDSNSYNRARLINSEFVEVHDDTAIKKSFEVERILKKRNRKYDKIMIVHYLIKWKSWEFEHNFWISEKDIENFMELVTEFENRKHTNDSETA
jgi:hypothetical protein